MQCFKSEFCLYQSIDHYCPDPGDEATFHGGHKITVLIWSDSIRRLESLQKKIQKSNFCAKDFQSYFNQWFYILIFHNDIIKMEWLLHRNTGSFRKHKTSVPYSVLPSNNYVILKGTFQCTAKNQSASSRQAFLSRPFLFFEKKSREIHLLCNRTLFYPSSYNFCYRIQNLTILLQHIIFCISLHSKSLSTLCIT